MYAVLASIALAVAWPEIPSEFHEVEGVVRKVETRKIHVYVHLASGETVYFLLGKRRLRELPRGETVRFTVVAVPQEDVFARYTGVAAKCGEMVYYSEAKYWAVHRFYKYGSALALVIGFIVLAYCVARKLRAARQDAHPPDGPSASDDSEGHNE
jgi:hypothetical protein